MNKNLNFYLALLFLSPGALFSMELPLKIEEPKTQEQPITPQEQNPEYAESIDAIFAKKA